MSTTRILKLQHARNYQDEVKLKYNDWKDYRDVSMERLKKNQ